MIALAEKQILTINGYTVSTVVSGEAAVSAVESDATIALVLMDIDLGPGIDGTEAAARVLTVRDLPVVFLTSHSEKSMVERVRGITRYGYVLKNSGEFVLLQAIEMAFELFRSRTEAIAGENLYRSVTNLTGDIIVQHDEAGRWTFLNDTACRFFGKSREELLGCNFMEFVHPEDQPGTSSVVNEIVETSDAVRARFNRQKTPKGWRLVEWNSEVVRDAAGNLMGFQATGRDVTEREATIRSLRQHETILRSLSENIPGVVYQFEIAPDDTPSFPFVSEGVADLAGTTAAEVMEDASRLIRTVHPDDRDRYEEAVRRSQSTLEPYNIRHRLISRDGTIRWIESHSTPIRLADGTVQWTGVAIDISEQMAMDEELAKRERNLRTVFEQATSGIVLANDDSFVVDCNQTAAKLLGYTQDELRGQHASMIIPQHLLEKQPLQTTIEWARTAGEPIEFDGAFARKDGTVIEALTRIRYLSGLPDGATHIVSFSDITSRLAAERKVRALLEEKEILLGEIHHRVKNDLNMVHAFASLQIQQTSSDETRRALGEMARRISVMGRVYDALHTTGGVGTVALGVLVESIVASLRDTFIPSNIEIALNAAEVDTPKVVAVSVGIVLNELVTNSVKYGFPEGRTGTIEILVEQRSEDELRLVVEDGGVGFDPLVVSAQAYGYGLTIVEALAEQHAGAMSIANGTGGGARVEVSLRVDQQAGET